MRAFVCVLLCMCVCVCVCVCAHAWDEVVLYQNVSIALG